MKKFTKASLAVLVIAGFAGIASAQDLSSNQLFKTKCAGCHGPNGEGKAALHTLPMKEAASKSEAELTKIIENGQGRMPAYKGKLTEAQVKELVSAIKAQK